MEKIKTYSESQDFRDILHKMLTQIEKLGIKQNNKFNVCLKRTANAVIDNIKVSYIKEDKIKSLEKHANVKLRLRPTAEQREKYFTACSITKFANNFFIKDNITACQLEDFNIMVKRATEAANALLPKHLFVLDAKHIPTIYSLKNKDNESVFNLGTTKESNNVSISVDGSCMQGKPKNWFDIYNDINTDEATLKIALLVQHNEIIARSLIWLDIPTEDIDRRKKIHPNKMFIDRIYTKTQDHREATQIQLINDIHNYYNVNRLPDNEESNCYNIAFANSYNWHDIKQGMAKWLSKDCEDTDYIKSDNIKCKRYPSFSVETLSRYYSYYPYCDTFQFFDSDCSNLSCEEDCGAIRLDGTGGEATEQQSECEQCGDRYDSEEDGAYIDTSDMSVCSDCATYCDERQEYILTDEAVYNNYSGCYHWSDDLDF